MGIEERTKACREIVAAFNEARSKCFAKLHAALPPGQAAECEAVIDEALGIFIAEFGSGSESAFALLSEGAEKLKAGVERQMNREFNRRQQINEN